MRKCRLSITALILPLVLISCMQEPPFVFAVKTESAEHDVVTETRDILLRRYNEFLPSRSSIIESKIEGSCINFVISNGSPSKHVITYLTETPGILEAFHRNKSIKLLWFTEQDLISASVVPEKGRDMLNVKITSDAGVRTAQLSSNNIGKKLTIEIDGRTVGEGFITDTLSTSFLVHTPKSRYAQETSAALTFGRLPTTVRVARWGNEIWQE